jgi:hypothetical protein
MRLMGTLLFSCNPVGLLLAPIEAGGDEFPMNFYRRVTKTRTIHRSAWYRNSANFAFTEF